MRKIFLLMILLCGNITFAGPKCTSEEKSTWQDQSKFQENLKKQGYKIKKFKVTSGNCYEIYGWDKESNKVEIYFNPITAKIVKKKSF